VLKHAGARGVNVTFSSTRAAEVYIALADGSIECMHTETKALLAVLRGHRHAVRSMACHGSQALMVSASTDTALLWSTDTFTRLRALGTPGRTLQQALFVPSGQHLLTCCERNVTLWDTSTFTACATYRVPAERDALKLRTVAVSDDSSLCVATGEGGAVVLWSLESGSLLKTITLPEEVGAVEQATWLPRTASVALLCGDGTLRMLNARAAQLALLVRQPADVPGDVPTALHRAAIDPSGQCACCTRSDGTLALYSLGWLHGEVATLTHGAADSAGAVEQMVDCDSQPELAAEMPRGTSRTGFHRPAREVQGVNIAEDLPLFRLGTLGEDSSLLNVQGLRALLRRFWQFPDQHRLIVWRFLLQLPANTSAHQALLARGAHPAYDGLECRLPLADRRGLMRLERLLSSLAHWCPIFGETTRLDSTVYPWLLTFGPDDLGAFEAVATTLANWCQRFYECHPNPPVELLAGVERLLRHHCPTLHCHLVEVGAGPVDWAWPLLESLFSRVLGRAEWLVLWDHLLAHEPVFLVVVTVAFVRRNGSALLLANDVPQVQRVLLRQSALQLRPWLRSAYAMFEQTPTELLPRMAPFTPLPTGATYPPAIEYPAAQVDYGRQEVQRIRLHEQELLRKRAALVRVQQASVDMDAALRESQARKGQMLEAEAQQREILQRRQADVEQVTSEVTFAMRDASLHHAHQLTQQRQALDSEREAVHAVTMQRLSDELARTEAMAQARGQLRAEELHMMRTEAQVFEHSLHEQQSAQLAQAQAHLAHQIHARQSEIALTEQQADGAHQAASEEAALRFRMESERRDQAAALAWQQQAATEAASQLHLAELQSSAQSAALQHQSQLQAAAQDEREQTRAALDAELHRMPLLAAGDDQAAEAMLFREPPTLEEDMAEQQAHAARELQRRREAAHAAAAQQQARVATDEARVQRTQRGAPQAEAQAGAAGASPRAPSSHASKAGGDGESLASAKAPKSRAAKAVAPSTGSSAAGSAPPSVPAAAAGGAKRGGAKPSASPQRAAAPARPAPASCDVAATPASTGCRSGETGSEAASSCMAGLQGLGLDTELMDRLKAEAQAGRLSADRASHGAATASSHGCSTSSAGYGQSLSPEGAWPASAAQPAAHQVHAHHHHGVDSSSSEEEHGASCTTCDLIQDHFQEHDAWVQSLKESTEAALAMHKLKESAEAVLAMHKRTQETLAQLVPAAAADSSEETTS
jgi:hypothetical protein